MSYTVPFLEGFLREVKTVESSSSYHFVNVPTLDQVSGW